MSEGNTEVKVIRKTDKLKLLEPGDKTKFFKDRMHELAFYFSLGASSTYFDNDLHIKKIHVLRVEKAKELKNKYLSIFHPDSNVNSSIDLDLNQVCQDIQATFHRVSGGKL